MLSLLPWQPPVEAARPPSAPTPAPRPALTSAELSEAIAAESHTIRLAIASGFGCLVANAAGDAAHAASVARILARRARPAEDAPAEPSDLDDVHPDDRAWWSAEARRLDERDAFRLYAAKCSGREWDREADEARYRDRLEAGLLA